jgi:hypothetical protein
MSGWVAGGAAVIGVAGSLTSARKNATAAERAQEAQERSAREDLDFRKAQYNRYLGLMGPIEEQLAAEAKSSEPLDYDKMAAQIKSQYAGANRNLSSSMSNRGMAGMGMDLGGMRGLAMGQAGATTDAYSKGLENRRNLGLTLTGRNQIGQAAQGVGVGMRGMTDLYGGMAKSYNDAAKESWGGFGENLGALGGMIQNGLNERFVPVSATPQTNLPVADTMTPITPTNTGGWSDYMRPPGLS